MQVSSSFGLSLSAVFAFVCLGMFVAANDAKASEGAVIQLAETPMTEVLRFRPDAMLFINRDYRLAESPEPLHGMRFMVSDINAVAFDVIEGGRLLILTPHPIDRAASQAAALEEQGFKQVDIDIFQLFGENAIDRVLVYEKEVQAGDSYAFDKWVLVAGFKEARGTRDWTRMQYGLPFRIYPDDLPNTGILIVDQGKNNRSGHAGITLTEAQNGDILAFYQNGSVEDNWNGHGSAGWSEYLRSTDGGETWGPPVAFPYSKEQWEGDERFSAIVYPVITAPDGTIVATVLRYADQRWQKQDTPVYFLSHDHGHTWEGPYDFDEQATVDDISMSMNTTFVHDGEIFIVLRGGRSNMRPGGPHTLWVSSDNGRTFTQRSQLPFEDGFYYWAAGALDDGSIIVYTYYAHLLEGDARRPAERRLPYTISRDGGRTWGPLEYTYFAKGIRNMQMSEKLGDYYFMHGRSGSYAGSLGERDLGNRHFVLYASKDGINWDDGTILMSRRQTPGGGDSYSHNAIVGRFDPDRPLRLLIQADISYDGPATNIHHWWVTIDE